MGGTQSTLSDPKSDLSLINANISNSTANLATKTDITNGVSNLARQSDLTILSSGLTTATSGVNSAISGLTTATSGVNSAISGLTTATSGITSATSGVTSATSTLQTLIPTLVTQSYLNTAIGNLATNANLNTNFTTINTNLSNSQGLTNVICPDGYEYKSTFSIFGGIGSNIPTGPYCVARPQNIYNVVSSGAQMNGAANTYDIAKPNAFCPYGDLYYNTVNNDNFPMCVISTVLYQQSACKYGIASTRTANDSNGTQYTIATCKTAP